VNLQANDFELFGLTQRFLQDPDEIDACWKLLQKEAHPDKFAAQGAAAQRVAMQWSARINEAYRRLKDPVTRAAYLCEINGIGVDAHTNTKMPAEFLLLQMQWREDLDDVCDAQGLAGLQSTVMAFRQKILSQFEDLLDGQHDYAHGVMAVRELMFVNKFLRDLEPHFDRLT
jgi:molecular chaperone HscB